MIASVTFVTRLSRRDVLDSIETNPGIRGYSLTRLCDKIKRKQTTGKVGGQTSLAGGDTTEDGHR